MHPTLINDIRSLESVLSIWASKIGNVAASKIHKDFSVLSLLPSYIHFCDF